MASLPDVMIRDHSQASEVRTEPANGHFGIDRRSIHGFFTAINVYPAKIVQTSNIRGPGLGRTLTLILRLTTFDTNCEVERSVTPWISEA